MVACLATSLSPPASIHAGIVAAALVMAFREALPHRPPLRPVAARDTRLDRLSAWLRRRRVRPWVDHVRALRDEEVLVGDVLGMIVSRLRAFLAHVLPRSDAPDLV